MSKYWFGTKKYGWGWVPNTWQGWAVTGLFLAYLYSLSVFIGDEGVYVKEYWLKVLFGLVVFLLIVKRTGPKPKWRWG